MKKQPCIVALSILILSGCSSSIEVIKEGTWGYDESISRSTTSGTFNRIAQDESGFYYIAPSSSSGAPEQVLSYYSFQTNSSMIVNSNQKQCSWTALETCTGYLEERIDELWYYANKLYLLYQKMNRDTEQIETILMQMDLDGTNRKEVMSLPVYAGQSGSKCFRFDKGFLYYLNAEGTLKKVDMKSWKEQPFFELEENKQLSSFMIQDDIVYLSYVEQSQQYRYDVIHDEVSKLDHYLLSVSDFGTIASSLENDHYVISLTKQNHARKVSDQVGLISTTEDYFLIDTTHYEEGEQATLMLFDWNGTILDTKNITYQDTHKKNLSFQFTLAKDGYYTYVLDAQDRVLLVKFPIKDNQLLDYIVVDVKGE